MPSISRRSKRSRSPLRRHAAIARRSWSASPGVKPAATIASCMTCSWKIGTPSVRSSTRSHVLARIGDLFLARTAPQIRMHHVALDRPRANDRDLDHEIVVTLRLAGAAASPFARATRSGTRPSCRRARSCRRRRRPRPERSRSCSWRPSKPLDQLEAAADRAQHAEAEHVDLQQTELLEIVLVPLNDGSLRHRGVLDRHELVERALGDHEAADVLRQMAREADQRSDEARASGALSGSWDRSPPRRCALARSAPPSHHCSERATAPTWPPRDRAPCRHRESRCAADR